MSEVDIEIIGEGEIGDKARQLVEKTPKLREIGFYAPRRFVLAEHFFDGFFQRNGLGNSLRDAHGSDLEERIKKGSMAREEFEALERVCSYYGDNPVIFRSSARGDASGTGVYESVVTNNHPSDRRRAMLKVLASYFSESAKLFRRDAKTGEGFGILIDPLMFNRLGLYGDFLAPLVSGHGYTSTLKGSGYIKIVPGFGGGVMSRDPLELKREDVEDIPFYEFLSKRREETEFLFYATSRNRAFMPQLLLGKNLTYNALAFYNGLVTKKNVHFSGELHKELCNLDFLDLFLMMEKSEEEFGPQYFEFAVVAMDGQARYGLVQIDDAKKEPSSIVFSDYLPSIAEARDVAGTGVRNCSRIVYCGDSSCIPKLTKFNEEHSDYILWYSPSLVSRKREIRYENVYNASVFLEIFSSGGRTASPIAHWGGQLEEAGKLFGVVTTDGLQCGDAEKEDCNGLTVYNDRFRVIASERADRLVVYNLG